MTRRPAAGVLLFDPTGHVLLVRIRTRRTWEHPGGRLRRLETPLTGALRELREETRVVVDPRFDRVTPLPGPVDDGWSTSGDLLPPCDISLGVPFFTFVVRLDYRPRVRLRRRELTDFAWVDRRDARHLIHTPLLPRLVRAFHLVDTITRS